LQPNTTKLIIAWGAWGNVSNVSLTSCSHVVGTNLVQAYCKQKMRKIEEEKNSYSQTPYFAGGDEIPYTTVYRFTTRFSLPRNTATTHLTNNMATATTVEENDVIVTPCVYDVQSRQHRSLVTELIHSYNVYIIELTLMRSTPVFKRSLKTFLFQTAYRIAMLYWTV